MNWTVGERSGEVKVTSSLPKLPKMEYFKPYTITDKMTAGQKDSAIKFNKMQQRLVEIGEMESK